MTDGQTLWYSTLGVGDGHDIATRGYLDSLAAVGFEGLRLPPSRVTGLLAVEPGSDLERYAPLVVSTPKVKPRYIEEGDPRIGQPKPVAFPEGGSLAGPLGVSDYAPVPEDQRVWRVGDFDTENTPREALATDDVPPTRTIVIHHDPGSAARLLGGLLRLGRPPGVGFLGVVVWEVDRIPHEIAAVLEDFDAMVVPSEHSRAALLAGGLSLPVHVIPHAADLDFWPEPPLADPAGSDAPWYGFYSIGTMIDRKNLTGLVAAFHRAFAGDPARASSARLAIKTSGTRMELNALLDNGRALSGVTGPYPKITLLTERWPMETIKQFHLAGDCYVDATRGEGFGLPHLEASLVGNPVITTGWGAAPEVLRVAGGEHMLTSYTLTQVASSMAKYGPYAENQKWAEPDLDDLADEMREMATRRPVRARSKWQRLSHWCSTRVVGEALAMVIRDAR